MDAWWLRHLQNVEYENALRDDIEKEIILEARELDQKCRLRMEIEERLISEAESLDEEENRCKLSPRSLRLKRLKFFEPETVIVTSGTNKTSKEQCLGITKTGVRCKKNSENRY